MSLSSTEDSECAGAFTFHQKHVSGSWLSKSYFLLVGVNTSCNYSMNHSLVTAVLHWSSMWQAVWPCSHSVLQCIRVWEWCTSSVLIFKSALTLIHSKRVNLSFMGLWPSSVFPSWWCRFCSTYPSRTALFHHRWTLVEWRILLSLWIPRILSCRYLWKPLQNWKPHHLTMCALLLLWNLWNHSLLTLNSSVVALVEGFSCNKSLQFPGFFIDHSFTSIILHSTTLKMVFPLLLALVSSTWLTILLLLP